MSSDSSSWRTALLSRGDRRANLWSPWFAVTGALIVFFVSLLCALVFSGVIELLADAGFSQIKSNDALANLMLAMVYSSGMLATLWLLLHRRKVSLLKDLGFRSWGGDDLKWLLKGIAIYFPLLAFAMVLLPYIPGIDSNQTQTTGYETVQGFGLLIAFVGLVVLPPFAEEIVFRGFLYRGLANGLKKYLAALITSIWFGAVHMQWNVAIDTFLLSLVLVYVLEKSNNLWVCVALHAVKNFTAFLFIFVLV